MKGSLLPASLVMAAAAVAAMGLLALRGGDPKEAEEPAAAGEDPRPRTPPARDEEPRLRPYETTATLTEDLRDVLAAGDAAAIEGECWRVSDALAPKAEWMLRHAAPAEASPRVRALLVLACGVHLPDDALLLGFLEDRAAPVRAAAALAAGYRREGERRATFLEGVSVPLGRAVAEETRVDLRARLRAEKDEGVRGTIEQVLAAG